jgi:hypothetical protein
MEMNDNTILRIKVPAHLYEAVKAQLTLKEAKQNFGTKDMKPVKAAKAAGAASDKPKASAPKKAATPKNAEAPKEEAKVPKDGHKKLGLEELKAIVELLNGQIAQLEEKKAPAEDEKEKMEEVKDKVEEKKEEMEESKWGREEYMDEPDYDERRQRFVRYQPKKTFRPKYVPKGQATMTKGDVGYSSFTKPDADKN